MHGNEYEYYIAATNKDIAQPVKQKNWDQVNHNEIPTETNGKIAVFSRVPWHSS